MKEKRLTDTPTFKELGLGPNIIKALDDMGYTHPTPIQADAIPPALQRKDVLGIAQTGTGKTGAFTLPVLHRLARGRARARMPRCLIICPTRELAAQVEENVVAYGKYLKLDMALLIGGVSFGEQDKKLAAGVDILIATPGRLLDQFERGKILLNGVETLVVDEADRMLDMGFIPDLEKIFKLTPFTRQVLFFSATMPKEVQHLVDTFLHQPVRIEIARQSTTAETVDQKILKVNTKVPKEKRAALRAAFDSYNIKNGIIFCNRKRDVDILARSLNKHGYSASPIHGDLPQSVRTKTLDNFKKGELKFLVASDVAARGIDIPDVTHVFNYDVPSHSEDYVHRIGRTGRAGKEGETLMLVTPQDDKYYKAILDLIKVDGIEELKVDTGKPSSSSKTSKSKSSKKSSDKKSSRKTADDKSSSASGNDNAPEETSSRRSRSDNRNRSGRSDRKSSRGRDRNGLPENKKTGFGDHVPAFFDISVS